MPSLHLQSLARLTASHWLDGSLYWRKYSQREQLNEIYFDHLYDLLQNIFVSTHIDSVQFQIINFNTSSNSNSARTWSVFFINSGCTCYARYGRAFRYMRTYFSGFVFSGFALHIRYLLYALSSWLFRSFNLHALCLVASSPRALCFAFVKNIKK